MSANYKKLGDYIQPVDIRNSDLKVSHLLGVSVEKRFIESIANTIGTDFSKYKIVKKGQFTYIPDTSRRGDKIGIALLTEFDEGLVSNIYTVFEITDTTKLLPEYLMLWFSRPEFDRYARYKSHGSVREIFDWDEMCRVELPVPDLKEQEKIVNTYNAITKRIQLKQKINENLEKTAQTIYKKMFVEDADENWKTVKLGKCIEVKYGKDHKVLAEGSIPVYGSGGIMRYAEKALFEKESVLIPRKGSLNNILYVDEPFWSVDTMFYTEMKRKNFAKYFYEFIKTKDFLNLDTGSAVPSMTTEYLNNIEILNPDDLSLEKFESNVSKIYISKKNNLKEISKLQELMQLVISKISMR